jgi:hypothetical protein
MVNDQQQPAPQPAPLTLPFGKGVILASNPDFLNGFQAGQNAYLAALRIHPEPYADGYLVELFLDKLEDMRLTSPYGVGYAVGWLERLAVKGGQV